MRPPVHLTENQLLLLRGGAAVAGTLFLASAALAAELARDHMAAIGTLCGASANSPHCGWCLAAAGLALAGLAGFATAVRKPGKLRLAPDQGQA